MTQQEFFNRYQYDPETDRIGGGTFGDVYKAYDLLEEREVAIKVAKIVKHGDKVFSLKDEFEAVKDLPLHQNIANYYAVYTFKTPQGVFDYAVIQYYKDGNLSDLIAANDLSFAEKEVLALQILDGLAFLHQHRVVHRDMKPSNILIHKRNLRGKEEIIPKIADFGLSKKAQGDRSRFTNSFGGGTLAYSSPEQLKNRELKFNTDLWAWAVIAYELLTGKRLFDATNSKSTGSAEQENEIYKQINEKQIVLNELPEKWQNALAVCLERNPEKRVQTAKEIRNILEGEIPRAVDEETTQIDTERTEIIKEPKEEGKKQTENNDIYSEHPSRHSEYPPRHSKLETESHSEPHSNPQPKNKKGVWIGLVAVALLLIGVFVWQGGKDKLNPTPEKTEEITEQQAWENLQNNTNVTIADCDTFLVQFPNSEHKVEVQKIKEEQQAWETLTNNPNATIADYTAFLAAYPNGKHNEEAKTKIQEIAQKAKEEEERLAKEEAKQREKEKARREQEAKRQAEEKEKQRIAEAEKARREQEAKRQAEEKEKQRIAEAEKARKRKKQRAKYGTFTDSRDGKTYKTVKIGSQVWMAENLNYTGSGIRHITDVEEWSNNTKSDGWCYYDNDGSNGKKYGVLYQWEAAKEACPDGWHLPSDGEWQTLVDYLGGAAIAGEKLKSRSGWANYAGGSGNGSDSSGFSGLPCGYRNDNGSFTSMGKSASFWSATAYNSSTAWLHNLRYYDSSVTRYNNYKSYGYSVRCVRD